MVELESRLNLRNFPHDEDGIFFFLLKRGFIYSAKCRFCAFPNLISSHGKSVIFAVEERIRFAYSAPDSSTFWRPVSLLVRCICGRVARPRPRLPELRTPEDFAVLWRVQMTSSMMILREKRS